MKTKYQIIILIIFIQAVLQPVKSEQLDFPEEVLQKYINNRSKQNVKGSQFGLKNTQSQQEIPLKHIDYKTVINNGVATVSIEQTYKNNLTENIETEYFFAISPESAFVELSVQINDKVIYGKVKEKEQAKQEYNDAIKQGKRAAYAEIVEEVHDIMKLNLGNLGPNEVAKIKLTYIEQLDIVMNKFWQFSLGNTFENRSLPNYHQHTDNMQKVSKPSCIDENDSKAYTMNVSVQVNSPSPIEFLDSPSHDIYIHYENENKMNGHVVFKNEKEIPNKYFVLLFRNKEINKPSVQISYDPKTNPDIPYAALVQFFPDFQEELSVQQAYKSFLQKFKNENKKDLRQDDDLENYLQSEKVKGEYIFVVDRSGSMNGAAIEATKQTLSQALDLLPKNSYFNIVSFGSRHQLMFKDSVFSSKQNILQAKQEIKNFQANFGGTEILQPLSAMLEGPMIDQYPKNIFLLTDGQVWNENEIVNKIREKVLNKNIRVYSLGMGNGVSQNLIRLTAYEGKGKFELIHNIEIDQLKQKLAYLIKDSITPFLEQFSLQYDENLVKIMVPSIQSITSIRKNEPFRTIIFLDKNFETTKMKLTCYDSYSDSKKSFEINLSKNNIINPEHQLYGNSLFQKLGIHQVIRTMLSNAAFRSSDSYRGVFFSKLKQIKTFKDVVQLSVDYQVLSDLTAFVLVDEKDQEPKQQQQTPLKIDIPIIKQAQTMEKRKNASFQKSKRGKESARIVQGMAFSPGSHDGIHQNIQYQQDLGGGSEEIDQQRLVPKKQYHQVNQQLEDNTIFEEIQDPQLKTQEKEIQQQSLISWYLFGSSSILQFYYLFMIVFFVLVN